MRDMPYDQDKINRPSHHPEDDMSASKLPLYKRILKKPGRNMFWAWIAYQTVKGTLTTSFIWIPLIYAWFHLN